MSSVEKLVSEYIADCAKNGTASILDIYKKAMEEVKEINTQLVAVEPLRLRRSDLQKITNHLSNLINTDNIIESFDDESEDMNKIKSNIIQIVRDNPPLTNRGIIQAYMQLDGEAYNYEANIIRGIKYLAMCGILDKEDKLIIKGPKWS